MSTVNTNNLNEYGIMKARSGDSIFSRVIKVRILEVRNCEDLSDELCIRQLRENIQPCY